MAQFDLKKATVYLRDGYREAGEVNNVAGYTIGATTMTIDGITGAVPVGTVFQVEGDDNFYVVSATTETLGNTTSITFAPGLSAAVADNDDITFLGRQLEIKVGEGNVTYDEKRTMEYKKDRGVLDTVREGDEEPLDVRLDLQWEWLSAGTTDTVPTPEEALKKEGLASSWESSSDDDCEPYAVDIVIVYNPECAGVESEVITLPDYRWESLNHDTRAGTLSTSGKCNVTRATKERLNLTV